MIGKQLDRLFAAPPPKLYEQLEQLIIRRAFGYSGQKPGADRAPPGHVPQHPAHAAEARGPDRPGNSDVPEVDASRLAEPLGRPAIEGPLGGARPGAARTATS